jgi:hypothetical protein
MARTLPIPTRDLRHVPVAALRKIYTFGSPPGRGPAAGFDVVDGARSRHRGAIE